MAKNKLPQTRGQFQLRGKVVGMGKAYEELTSKKGNAGRKFNIGVQTSENNTIYVGFNQYASKEVTFNKYDKETKRNEQAKVAWNDRLEFKKEGFNPMFGLKMGVESNGTGFEKVEMFKFDACEYLNNNLQDGDSVYIRGDIKYESYEVAVKEDGVETKQKRRVVKLEPTQIYKASKEIDFKAEDFKEMSEFTQSLVFTGIDKEEERFLLDANIVNYDNIETAGYIIEDSKLAGVFKKKLKPYTAIKVTGLIKRVLLTEEVEEETEEEDFWGTKTAMAEKVVKVPSVTELVIIGADPNTIDIETYTEEELNAQIKAEGDFGDDDWGTSVEDDDTPWG